VNRMQPRAGLAAIVATLALCAAPEARANGRFPFAQHVIVGPGATSQQIVLRATFGVLWSRDGGRSFDWACEQSLGFEGNWDPAVVFGASATLLVGLPDGASQSADGCDFARIASVPTTPMVDLAASRDGMTVFGVESVPVVENRVFASIDGGRTFEVRARGPANVSFDTVELAPSDPRRVYVSGVDGSSRGPRLFRSDDGGATLSPLSLPAESLTGATGAYVSAVAQRDPDTLFVRVARDGGSHLVRSVDGGRTWTVVLRATGDLRGFAMADDGRLWTGGPDDGLRRSDDNGASWTPVAAPGVTCLRHHAGALYLCVDWVREPYALGRIADGASTIEPVLRFQDARGAFACAATSSAQRECAPRWAAQRMMVTTRPTVDAGRDSSLDATVDAEAPRDASLDASSDGSTRPPTSGVCGCRVVAGRDGFALRNLVAVALALSFAVGARRRRAR
jgi:hypothetical protein